MVNFLMTDTVYLCSTVFHILTCYMCSRIRQDLITDLLGRIFLQIGTDLNVFVLGSQCSDPLFVLWSVPVCIKVVEKSKNNWQKSLCGID